VPFTETERKLFYGAAGLGLFSFLYFLLATRRGHRKAKGFGAFVRGLYAWLTAGVWGAFVWLGLLYFLPDFFQVEPGELLLQTVTGLAMCLVGGLVVLLLRTKTATDGSEYGLFTCLLAAGGLYYARQYQLELLAPFADWVWWKWLLPAGAGGLLSGALLGLFLGRMRKGFG